MPGRKGQTPASAPAGHSPRRLRLTSAFPSPSRYIAFLLCCLALIDTVICVLKQPAPINPPKYPIIKKASHLQLWGGEEGSLCSCLLAVLMQTVSLGARDKARVCAVIWSARRLRASEDISRAGRAFKGSSLQKLGFLQLHCQGWSNKVGHL